MENPEAILAELTAIARHRQLDVRVEPLKAASGRAGGLCVVAGRRMVLLDSGAGVVDQVLALAAALMDEDLTALPLSDAATAALTQARQRHERSHPRAAPPPIEPRHDPPGTRYRGKPGIVSARPRRAGGSSDGEHE